VRASHGTGTICLHLVVFCLILRRGYCAHGTGTICLHLVVFCLILLRRGYIRAILWDGNDLFASSCVLSHSQTGLLRTRDGNDLFASSCVLSHSPQTGLYIRAILWDGNDLFASSCVLSHSPQTGLYIMGRERSVCI
jgi:hypothetical protein